MDLRVEGAGELANRLQKFDKAVYSILLREVREASKVVADDAKSRMPAEKVLFGGRSTGRERLSAGWGVWSRTTGGTGSVGVVQLVTGSADWGYDGKTARDSIKVRARQYRRARSRVGVIGVVSLTNPGAVLWALMGQKPTGSRFEREVMSRYGTSQYPRALGPAWSQHAPAAGVEIDAALDRARISIGL